MLTKDEERASSIEYTQDIEKLLEGGNIKSNFNKV